MAIIAILSALAIPKFLAARTTSLEGAGAASIRSVSTAVVSFNAKFGVYPATMSALGGNCTSTAPSLTAGCQIDDTFATSGLNNQYNFTYSTTGGQFTINADPIATSSAQRHYYTDSNLTVRYSDGSAATATSTPLGN